MGLRIVGSSLLVSLAITLVAVGVWNLSVPLAVLIGNPHSPEAMGCVRYTFMGIFIGAYILSFCWQVWQATNGERTE